MGSRHLSGRKVEPFDLVVMATHGYGGMQRWVMGSVTERVLHQAKLPLLVVHAATDDLERRLWWRGAAETRPAL